MMVENECSGAISREIRKRSKSKKTEMTKWWPMEPLMPTADNLGKMRQWRL
jgi:hypothetical protein